MTAFSTRSVCCSQHRHAALGKAQPCWPPIMPFITSPPPLPCAHRTTNTQRTGCETPKTRPPSGLWRRLVTNFRKNFLFSLLIHPEEGFSIFHRTTKLCAIIYLFGCETWSPTLMAKHRLRVFQDRKLRKIFGTKKDDIIEEWRRLHDQELLGSQSFPNIIRMMGGACGTYVRNEKCMHCCDGET